MPPDFEFDRAARRALYRAWRERFGMSLPTSATNTMARRILIDCGVDAALLDEDILAERQARPN